MSCAAARRIAAFRVIWRFADVVICGVILLDAVLFREYELSAELAFIDIVNISGQLLKNIFFKTFS